MKLLLLFAVAVALFSTYKACELRSLSAIYIYSNLASEWCRITHRNGEHFPLCGGRCLSSVQFKPVMNLSATDPLGEDRAYTMCHGVQNCCHPLRYAAVYDYELDTTCPRNTLPGYILITNQDHGCQCNPCYEFEFLSSQQRDVPRTLQHDNCRISASQYYDPSSYDYHDRCTIASTDAKVTVSVTGGGTCDVTVGTQDTCSGLCTSTDFEPSSCRAVYTTSSTYGTRTRSEVQEQCPGYEGYGIKFRHTGSMFDCICSSSAHHP